MIRNASIGAVRRRYAALRAGEAHLAQGDAIFRGVDGAGDPDREVAARAYRQAVHVVDAAGVAPENPWRQDIARRSQLQLGKLRAAFNILGYRASYVPVLRPPALQESAERRITAAKDAVTRFETFKSKADQIQDVMRRLDFERDVRQGDLRIADLEVADARNRSGIAGTQVDRIAKQREDLKIKLGADLTGALLGAAGFAFLAGSTGGLGAAAGGTILGTSIPGIVGALSGAGSAAADYHARQDDLEFQEDDLQIEHRIADRDVEIAQQRHEIPP